jgi:hypothetical protein
VAALLAVCLFFGIYGDPLAFLAGESGFFEVGDAPQHVTGWLLYAKDLWHWPLLVTRLISPPDGVTIALTDSIPLAALIFKPFAGILPENFHYFGLWHLGSKIAQATGGVFLIRSLGQRGLVASCVAASMALLWPAALDRVAHTALGSHGVLLFALGLYFRGLANGWTVRRSIAAFTAISVVGLLIHPYLLAMIFPLGLAFAGDRLFRTKDFVGSAVIVGSVTLLVAGVALALGYSSGGSGHAEGFAHFSMNLLSPFCGGSLAVCATPDATGGQAVEGYNYLGTGTFIVILAAVLIARWQDAGAWLTRHALLLALLAGLTIYSLSNQIFLGDQHIFSYSMLPIHERLSEVFRASGRFFWLVGYVLLFLGLAKVLQARLVVALPIVAIALGAQWMDTSDLRAETRLITNPARPFDYSGWLALEQQIDHIVLSPTYGCEEISNMHYLYFQIVAARLGASINTGYLARSAEPCALEDVTQLVPGTLHVFLDPVLGRPAVVPETQAAGSSHCVRWPAWGNPILCLPTMTIADWQRINPDLVSYRPGAEFAKPTD